MHLNKICKQTCPVAQRIGGNSLRGKDGGRGRRVADELLLHVKCNKKDTCPLSKAIFHFVTT